MDANDHMAAIEDDPRGEKDGPCGICGFSDWPKDCPGRKNDDGTTCAYIGQLQEVANRETLSAAYWKDKAAYYEQSYIALDVHMRNCPQSARQEMPSADEIKLACGEMTAQELRTAKAVLGWFIRRADKSSDTVHDIPKFLRRGTD